MHLSVLITIVLIISININDCQAAPERTIVLDEDFIDNRRGWELGTQSERSLAKLEGGNLILSAKPGNSAFLSINQYIDQSKDYSIRFRFKFDGASQSSVFGFVWGRLGNKFNIASFNVDGQVRLYENGAKAQLPGYGEWKSTGKINGLGQWEDVTITVQDGRCAVELNDSVVLRVGKPRLHMGGIGFFMLHDVQCTIDFLRVSQVQFIPEIPQQQETATPENLGTSVNSPYDDYLPTISPDGRQLLFTVLGDPKNSGGSQDRNDIWFTEPIGGGRWSNRKNIGPPLNNAGNNWVIMVTPDNQSMVVANQYYEGSDQTTQGISRSVRQSQGWSLPKAMTVDSLFNTSGFYQFYLSQDQKVLLIAAALKVDNATSNDIYVAFAKPDGNFGIPKSLGETVNTPLDEFTPFLSSDGVTLYYSTSGKPGYGSEDVFMCRRLDSTWTRWSDPVNLGPTINTVGPDRAFTIPASGDYAFLCSTVGSIGGYDIFKAKLPDAGKPFPVVLVSGKVLNGKTKAPVGATIRYYDLLDNRDLGLARSSPDNGAYKIVLPAGRKYSFLAEREGFYATSQNLDLENLNLYSERDADLLLNPIEVGSTIRLNNLFFDTGKFDLRTESFAELERLLELLTQNMALKIVVDGHTDDVGTPQNNQVLSENRAKTVVDFLVSKGIAPNRLQWKGHGKKKPVAKNASEEGKQQNRRVEFTIVSQ